MPDTVGIENMSGRAQGPPESSSKLPLSIRVVDALADAEGVGPADLPSLAEYADLEALEALVASADEDLSVSFRVEERLVEVDGAGAVRVS